MRVTPVLEQSIIALVESPHVMSALLHSMVSRHNCFSPYRHRSVRRLVRVALGPRGTG